MLKSLILGFGRAGRGLHLHCLHKAHKEHRDALLFDPRVGVVDPRMSPVPGDEAHLDFFASLGQVSGFDPDSTVVHICTPPELHFDALLQTAEHGYRKIIMEKPLTTSLQELETIRFLQARWSLDILVVANWLSSSLTNRLSRSMASGEWGPLRHLAAEQNKARLSRTLSNPGHGNAFDVEIPHLTALALKLGGTDAEIIHASSANMRIGGSVFPHMGKAQMSLRHAGGVTSELHSNLASPIRKRTVQLYFDDYRVTGYYPCGEDDSYSWLQIYSADGRLLDQQVLYDDPLTRVFAEFYEYYDGRRDKPDSDLPFNTRVVQAICEAKTRCGLLMPEEASESRDNQFVHNGVIV